MNLAQFLANFAVKFFLKLLLLIIFPLQVYSQSEKLSENLIEIAEDLASDELDPSAVESFTSRLHDLSEDPVDINSPDPTEISRLFFLSDFQVKALIDYIKSSGQIVSLFEISNIPGFDKETVMLMSQFIDLESKPIENSNFSRIRITSVSNFSIKPGNTDSSYLGSDWKILSKHKISLGGFSAGLTIEKDAGEKFLSGKPKRPDFLSGFLTYSGKKLIKKVIIGDFSCRFGQGSNLSSGMRRTISLTSPGFLSGRDEIRPYTSSGETKFLRGVAAELGYKNSGFFLFLSQNYTDATLESSNGASYDYVKTFYDAGIHNTSSLLNKKHDVSVMSYGIDANQNFHNIKLGFVFSGIVFSLPVIPDPNDPEKIYDFRGKRNNLWTLYYNTFINKILLFGELSLDASGNHAMIQGVTMRPSDRLTVNFLARSFSPGYSSFFGQGPGVGSQSSNDNGLLGNFAFEAFRHFFIYGGYDIHVYPWLKYRCNSPSTGMKIQLKLRYTPTEQIAIDAAFDFSKSLIDNNEVQGIHDQNLTIARNFKIIGHYKVYDNLIFGTRIDYKVVSPAVTRGLSLFEDINLSLRSIPLTIWVRYCIFNTDDWSSRIYTYENDLLYSFSIPALYGEGTRSYLMAKLKLWKSTELRVKYGITSSQNFPVSSRELKMQLKVGF